MTDIRASVQELIQGILEGRILQTFEHFYADDVIMTENRIVELIGKETNRKNEEFFTHNFQLHSVEFGKILIDGDLAAIESTWDITFPDGKRVLQHQVSVQSWCDGRIVREDFYHA